jgi:hypothetical protein
LKRLCGHSVEEFLSVLLDRELAERRESRAQRSGVPFTLDPGAKIAKAGRTRGFGAVPKMLKKGAPARRRGGPECRRVLAGT